MFYTSVFHLVTYYANGASGKTRQQPLGASRQHMKCDKTQADSSLFTERRQLQRHKTTQFAWYQDKRKVDTSNTNLSTGLITIPQLCICERVQPGHSTKSSREKGAEKHN